LDYYLTLYKQDFTLTAGITFSNYFSSISRISLVSRLFSHTAKKTNSANDIPLQSDAAHIFYLNNKIIYVMKNYSKHQEKRGRNAFYVPNPSELIEGE